jgi:hypothetical protein
MNATTHRRTRHLIDVRHAAVFAAALIVASGLASAAASAEPEPHATVYTRAAECGLTRIADQLMRCDNLTGAGVSAPPWVREQQAYAAPRPAECVLTRIADQLMRCDNLTGAGVSAPPAVPSAAPSNRDTIQP